MDFRLSSLEEFSSHGLSYCCFHHLQRIAASAAASTLYSPTEPDTLPAGWPQICPATPGQAQAPTLLSLLEEASKPLCSYPEPGCGLLGKGKNLWQFFSVFLIWRAMRLTDVSKCLFPECCDKMKPALTGTCSLFPSWSLICHCWRLEDLNGSETDTSLGLLPNARSMYVSRPLSLPEKFTEGQRKFLLLLLLLLLVLQEKSTVMIKIAALT